MTEKEFSKRSKTRGAVAAFAALLGLALAGCTSETRHPPVARLSSDFEPLRTAFNRDAGKVRLLLLVDPH